ncbi:hypothetical protein FHX42_001118 [Saccharopolyspora lacisalsi]|uniref:Uncharacterized protein n=1 Tax=Halosaccharopolyspora lacisalsi TaxID=1000566 RepID=A0A839DSR6_9PSEU|nr:hypothetical protein [Halosaccharopolyspora lacisalsi]
MFQALLYALLHRSSGVEDELGFGNGGGLVLKAAVQIRAPVSGDVCAVGLVALQAVQRDGVGAGALDETEIVLLYAQPMQEIDLFGAGEGAAVQQDNGGGFAIEEPPGGAAQQLDAEIVLLPGVIHVRGWKNLGT